MALEKSPLSGVVAFGVATLVARAVGGERLATRIGLLTGGAVAVSTWLSADRDGSDAELDAETSVAE